MKQRRQSQLSRQDFLFKSGGFITAAALGSHCSTYSQARFSSGATDPLQNARASGLQTPILQALAVGISAPNPHNTQAWKFRLISDTEALLYVDETRILPETDPTFRQVHLGQGCLLELLSVGAGEIGMESRISLFPEGYDPTKDLGKKPVARIRLLPSEVKDPMYAFVSHRRTVRSAYGGPDITQEEYHALAQLTAPRVSKLKSTNSQNLKEHLKFHFQGMESEMGYFPTADESRKWFRIGDDEIYGKRDGISLAGNGITGLKKWFFETFFLSHDPDVFHSSSNQTAFLDSYRENLFSVKGQILLITSTNTVNDWVLCGRDYARLQLAAHSLGLVMRPTSQLMQEFPAMMKLAKKYNRFVGVHPPAKIQINALLGRSEEDFQAPRRPIEDMII